MCEMTNGDYVRSLPDEELVFVIHCLKTCTIPNNDRDCYKCKIDFLKKERAETNEEANSPSKD